MKFWLVTACLIFLVTHSNAQTKTAFDRKQDSLKIYSKFIVTGGTLKERMDADSMFTKVLVRTLLMPHSFDRDFDSVKTVSILRSPDNTFRIFTWQMLVSENLVRQRGAIQMKTEDGGLKLIPLIDKSDIIINSGDTVTGPSAWLGAIYYKILLNKSGNKNYYTLLGFDANNIRSDKKIIEVMQFNERGIPVFGGNYFDVPALPSAPNYKPGRIIVEYKKNAGARLNFSEEENLILVEHLVSETNEPNKKHTLIPDGDYTGFKWNNGKWVFSPKVFTTTPEAEAPVPQPFTESKVKNQ